MSLGRLLAMFVPVLTSCELGALALVDEPLPPTDEVLLVEADGRVLLQLGSASGFPDPVGSYAVVIERADGTRQIVMEGTSQRTSIAHQVDAGRLPSGALGVALGRSLCRASVAGTRCADLEREHGGPELVEALRWRIERTGRAPYECAPAALALAHHDPAGALPILEALNGSGGEVVRDAEVRAVIARLRGDRAAVAAIGNEIPDAHNPELVGFSRACIPALEAPLRAELAHRPDSIREAVETALSACP
jgi:hypothetical protein